MGRVQTGVSAPHEFNHDGQGADKGVCATSFMDDQSQPALEDHPLRRVSLLIIFAVALLPRLLFVAYKPAILYDTYLYEEIAYSIAHGCGIGQIRGIDDPVRGYSIRPLGETQTQLSCDHFTPTYIRTPLYPLFLSIFYRLSLSDQWARVFQAILDSLTAVALFAFAWRYFNRFTGWFAGLLFALHPFVIFWPSYILTESLFTDLLTAAMLLIVIGWMKNRKMVLFAGGVGLGIATLCRTTSILIPLFLFLIFLRSEERRRWTSTAARLALILAGFGVTLAPWVVRNDRIFHEPFLVSGVQSTNLWVASLDWDPSYENSGIQFATIERMLSEGDTFGFDPVVHGLNPLTPIFGGTRFGDPENVLAGEKILRAQALVNIRRAPLRFLWNRVRTFPGFLFESFYYFPKTYSVYWREGNWWAVAAKIAYNFIFHLLVFILALLGCLQARRSIAAFMMLIVVFYLAVVHVPLYHEVRYSLPLYPFLGILGGLGVQTLRDWRNGILIF